MNFVIKTLVNPALHGAGVSTPDHSDSYRDRAGAGVSTIPRGEAIRNGGTQYYYSKALFLPILGYEKYISSHTPDQLQLMQTSG